MAKPSNSIDPPASMPVGKRELDVLIAKGQADPSAIRTLRCRTVAQGRFAQVNYIRNLPPQPVIEDEPEGLSGETTAPNASEALLAAFGSCLAVGIHANAVAQGIPITALALELAADLNTTAVWGGGQPQSGNHRVREHPRVGPARSGRATGKSRGAGATCHAVVAGRQHAAQSRPPGRDAGAGHGARCLSSGPALRRHLSVRQTAHRR